MNKKTYQLHVPKMERLLLHITMKILSYAIEIIQEKPFCFFLIWLEKKEINHTHTHTHTHTNIHTHSLSLVFTCGNSNKNQITILFLKFFIRHFQ